MSRSLCTLLDIPSWFFMYGVYGFVRVSAVNELEGEVEVACYAAAVILLSIVVPFCFFVIIIMVIMYSYCKRTDGSFSSSFFGLMMMTMIMTMMIGLVVFLTLVKSRTTRLTKVFCSAVVLGEKE